MATPVNTTGLEIISPSERSSDTQAKLHAYLRHGTQEVWQIYPKSQSVVIHRDGHSTMAEADVQITSPILPGFGLSIATLFAPRSC